MTDRHHDVVLVRHGRTALNAAGRLRGLADPELDAIGFAEAHATANAVKGFGLTGVFSSPLRRAVVTATIIADASAVPVEVVTALDDRDYGPWTGHVKADVVREWGSVDDAPGVEATTLVLERSRAAIDELVRAGPGPICIVTHDAVIRPLLARIRPGLVATVDTGSWAVLRYADDAWHLVSFDNTAAPDAP